MLGIGKVTMAEKKKGPRQKPLPGMENRKIAALQDAAMSYAEIRDERQALSAQEVDLKKKLIGLMHKYKKTEYIFGTVKINLVMEEETVKVKIKRDSEEEYGGTPAEEADEGDIANHGEEEEPESEDEEEAEAEE